MARITRRFDWLVIDNVTPSARGSYQDADGRWAYFDMTFHVRRWHPGYWLAFIRAIFRKKS